MQADGALQQKLATWLEGQKVWAEAVSKYQGQWVPSVVMGSGQSGAAASGAQGLVDLLTAKTARELGLDMSMQGKTRTNPR